ncbi:MAG: hypothetical protein NT169_17440 [Chloroflexi bacterium]|nr:hypothetical protein [Chloroflexota bacterium]
MRIGNTYTILRIECTFLPTGNRASSGIRRTLAPGRALLVYTILRIECAFLLLLLLLLPAAGRATAVATTNVTWSDFAPTTWVTALPVSAQVVAASPAGLTPATAAYAISTDGGNNWSPWTTAGLTVSGELSTTQTITVTGLTVGDAATANRLRFQIEEAGGVTETSPAFAVLVDTTRPTSALSRPADGTMLRIAPAIEGVAADATSGVSQAAVSIRATATGLYWDGAMWVVAEHWLAATGTTAWAYTGSQPAWATGAAYTLRSRATDVAGNAETPGPGVSFTFDATPPTVTVLAPNGGEVWAAGRVYTITWSASDTLGLASAPITLSVSYNNGGAWTPIAAAITNNGNFPWTPPAVDSAQVWVEVEAVDRAGNRATDRSNATFTLSSSPPAAPLDLQASPAVWTNTANFALTWTNPPGLAAITGAWYKLDATPIAPTDGTFITTTNWIAGIQPAADGSHPIYVWLQDQFGRADQTHAATTTLYLDRTPPSPPFALQGTPARTWTNVNQFAERWTNPPDLSGIVGAYYRINRPGLFPTDGIFISTTNVINNIQAPADGKHDLYIWLMDAAGNVDQNNRNIDPQVFWFDSTPPISTAAVTPAPSETGWYNTPVSVGFSAVDGPGGSGVEAVLHRLDNAAWDTAATLAVAAEGVHTVEYYGRDVAGNNEAARTLTVNLDFSPPVVSLTADRPPQVSGWYTAAVTLTLTVTDTLSPAVSYYRLDGGAWQTGSHIAVTANGVHQVDYYGQDAAGNSTATQTLRVKLDATPPATAYLIEGTQGQNGWFTSPLTVRLVPTDSGSGVATTVYRINDGPWQTGVLFQLTTDGAYTLVFYSVDVAGNVETTFPVQVKLDTAAPTAAIAIQTTPANWSQVNRFNIQWANPTDLSGIAGVYYRLDTEPTAPDDGIFSPLTNRLDNLTVPDEGIHRLYLWLRDNAGNADHRNRAIAPLLRYDATPPTTAAQAQGVAGTEGWYRSVVTVTLDATDAQSGVVSTRYSLDAGPWTVGASIAITIPEKHVLEYSSEDVAGNVEPMHRLTIRIDTDPPAAPINLTAGPTGWQHFNDFRLLWQEPRDLSGIAGVYIRFDQPPADPTDGTFYAASESLAGLQAPGEGKHDLYVWLADHAGNSDPATAVALPAALWYDGMPPVTNVALTGNLGQNGWYLGPVAFTLSAADSGSGIAATHWQLDDGEWTPGMAFTVTADGPHTVRVASSDVAGNNELPLVYDVAIDQQPPLVRMKSLSRYQSSPQFDVTWWGADPIPGSDLAAFEVQVRDGLEGSWQNWLSGTTLTRATFYGQRGHSYAFRVRAHDRAGNVQSFTDGSAYTVVETVRNSSFDTGNFSDWTTSGLLRKAVVPTDGPGGATVLAARLGSPEYGPSIEEPGQVPVGNAAISQTITVPALTQVARPTLAFWYRVYSYDVLYSERLKRFVDTFEVSVGDPATGSTPDLLLRTGNVTNRYGALYDSGWQFAALDLRPYAGRTVNLTFTNYNREDNLFNTWSFVDAIQVQDWPYGERRYLPLVASKAAESVAVSTAIESVAAAADNLSPSVRSKR